MLAAILASVIPVLCCVGTSTRMVAYLTYRVMHAVEPVLFPAPSHCVQAPKCSFPMTVYAHRGGPLEHASLIENTLPAFKNAAALGVDLLELDVQLTADRQVVVHHDKALGRVAGADSKHKGRSIADYSYQGLPAIVPGKAPAAASAGTLGDAQQAVQPGLGKVHGATTMQEPQRIPLLSEIFSSFPDIPIQVDVKVDQPGLVQAVHALVRQYAGRRDKLLWGSFRHNVQCELLACDPGIPLFTSAFRAIFLRVAHAAGQLDKVHIYESATIVPWRMRAPWWSKQRYWFPFLTRSYVEALAARGVDTIYFGPDLNSTDAYQACLAAGARGICTDRPSLLQSYLKSAGQAVNAAAGTAAAQ